MIIWGTRVRTRNLTTGEFHCPRCNARRTYIRKHAGRYFALYFIPLFQTQDLGEFVECQTCKQAYKPDILSYRPPSREAQMMAAVRGDLDSGTPVHLAQGKLINSGLSAEAAAALIAEAAGPQTACPKCGFKYRSTVRACSNCGAAL